MSHSNSAYNKFKDGANHLEDKAKDALHGLGDDVRSGARKVDKTVDHLEKDFKNKLVDVTNNLASNFHEQSDEVKAGHL